MASESLAGLRHKLADALFDGANMTVALRIEDLARAVAREEIERDKQEPARARQEPARQGVRVRVTEEAVEAVMPEIGTSYDSERYDVASRAVHAAAPHMEVMVDRSVRDRIATEIEEADEAGESYRHLADDILTDILGITITDGDSDA